MIWLSILGIMAILGGGGYWCWITKDNYDAASNTYLYMQYGGYALWGLDALFAVIVICCCSRIRLAVAITKVTG